MPNYNLIGPIKANTITSSEIASSEGIIFSVTTGVAIVAANNYLGVDISNPSGSNKTLCLLNLCISSNLEVTMEIILDGLVNGTSITPHNLNTAYSSTTLTTASYKNQSGDPIASGTKIIGAFAQASGVTIYPCNGNVKITPNHSIAFRIQNKNGGSNNYISLNVVYIES
ncbi:hypothetical protein [Marinisporobacter balticus]|uniref:Uncharacterized protein n=1 Tax=Marinisporobacter balticus TaxID=2018667 RepID=A0A4V2SBC6_9FIRM|nr:hypothetical protein [Marinisporobacter balticus]TCO74950.1 hypothetical protein EV214_11021 [Marinisporobacter balticus]